MNIHVCTTVFNRHDLLRKLMFSLKASHVPPTRVYVVDHSYDTPKVLTAVKDTVSCPVDIVTLEDPGVAHSGNWCLKNVPETRILICDDIQVGPDTLEQLADAPGDFVSPVFRGQFAGYTCFKITDACVEKVGFFDEMLSPGYLYFEDWDYTHRMSLVGVAHTSVEAAYNHEEGGHQTLNMLTPQQMQDHHRKFRIARKNYYAKWPENKPRA